MRYKVGDILYHVHVVFPEYLEVHETPITSVRAADPPYEDCEILSTMHGYLTIRDGKILQFMSSGGLYLTREEAQAAIDDPDYEYYIFQ